MSSLHFELLIEASGRFMKLYAATYLRTAKSTSLRSTYLTLWQIQNAVAVISRNKIFVTKFDNSTVNTANMLAEYIKTYPYRSSDG